MPMCMGCGRVGLFLSLSPEKLCESCVEKKAEQDRVRAQHERERQAIIARKASEFDSLLTSIPTSDISASPCQLERRSYADMPEVKYSNITKSTNRSLYDRYIVVDVETSGLNPARSEIIELSAIYFESFEPILSFSSLVKPNKTISAEATAVNGITDDDVSDAPALSDIVSSFVQFLRPVPLVGYNLPFDLKFIYCAGIDVLNTKRRYVDVLPLARKYASSYEFSLSEVCDSMCIFRPVSHRGLSDCLATGFVFNKLLSDYIV